MVVIDVMLTAAYTHMLVCHANVFLCASFFVILSFFANHTFALLLYKNSIMLLSHITQYMMHAATFNSLFEIGFKACRHVDRRDSPQQGKHSADSVLNAFSAGSCIMGVVLY